MAFGDCLAGMAIDRGADVVSSLLLPSFEGCQLDDRRVAAHLSRDFGRQHPVGADPFCESAPRRDRRRTERVLLLSASSPSPGQDACPQQSRRSRGTRRQPALPDSRQPSSLHCSLSQYTRCDSPEHSPLIGRGVYGIRGSVGCLTTIALYPTTRGAHAQPVTAPQSTEESKPFLTAARRLGRGFDPDAMDLLGGGQNAVA